MKSMKQIKKTIFGSFMWASLLLCIFISHASQQMPTPAATSLQTTGQPDQSQQPPTQQTQPGIMPDQGQQSPYSVVQPLQTGSTTTPPAATPMTSPTAAPTDSTVQSMPPVTIDTMTTPQTGTPTQPMPEATTFQPLVTATPPEAQISAALAPTQSTQALIPTATTQYPQIDMTNAPSQTYGVPPSTVTPGQSVPTAPPTMSVPSAPQTTGALGLSITNPTQYPVSITLHIMPSNRVIQKDIPAGQTVDLLSEPLSKNETYTVSGSLFQTVITKTTITTLSGPGETQPSQFINTKTNRISSTKNWSVANPGDQKIHLTIDFTERQGAESTLEIRQQ